jgi:hypothetical protein
MISSSNGPPAALFSLDASASRTTLSLGVPSRTSAPTPALDQTYLDFQIILGMLEEKPDGVADLLIDWITAHRSSAYFHFATATTPEGVHWYHRHSVY